MTFGGWNYAFFPPSALALAGFLVTWRAVLRSRTAAAVALVAAGFWFVSSAVLLSLLFGARATPHAQKWAGWQRDLGYAVGGSIALALPFAFVAGLVLLGRRLYGASDVPFGVASLAAAISIVVLPPLFAVGWVSGCVFSGYPSCM